MSACLYSESGSEVETDENGTPRNRSLLSNVDRASKFESNSHAMLFLTRLPFELCILVDLGQALTDSVRDGDLKTTQSILAIASDAVRGL